MLIQQGEARDPGLDRRLAFTLAAVAGSVNAAAFLAVGFFSANMTGNISSLSSLLTLGQWQHGLGYLTIVLAFISGAALSTLLVEAGLRRDIPTIYAKVVLIEAFLLAALGAARSMLPGTQGVPMLMIGLSFLMGLQNAIVTHISHARVRTTHMSGMATDVGVGLAKLLALPANEATRHERRAIVAKLHLHLGTIAAFLAGGILGVSTYRWIGDLAFAVSALPLLLVASAALWRAADA